MGGVTGATCVVDVVDLAVADIDGVEPRKRRRRDLAGAHETLAIPNEVERGGVMNAGCNGDVLDAELVGDTGMTVGGAFEDQELILRSDRGSLGLDDFPALGDLRLREVEGRGED